MPLRSVKQRDPGVPATEAALPLSGGARTNGSGRRDEGRRHLVPSPGYRCKCSAQCPSLASSASITSDPVPKALAGRDRVRLQPSGAYAANLLGLSEQVPAKVVFLTDGPSRVVKVGPMTVQLRRTTPRNIAAAGRLSGLVIQALRHLGSEHITPERITLLERALPADDRRALLKDLALAPTWMHRTLKERAHHDAGVPASIAGRAQTLHR